MSINFFKGYASNELFPTKQIEESYKKVINIDLKPFDDDKSNQNPLNYGTDPGNLTTRKEVSKFLNQYFDRPASDPDCFNLTNGASFGMGIILNKCTKKDYTERVFIVSPCYYLANFCFLDYGYKDQIRSINETPGDEYEIDLKSLEDELKSVGEFGEEFYDDPLRGKERIYKSIIYIVPSYSNPGGLTYSMKTRTKLLQLARKHNMLIICDDVYDLLTYDNVVLPRLVYIDRDTTEDGYGNVVSNSSTSKILAPGLRFGWHETATPKLAAQLSQEGCIKSGGTPSQLNSCVVEDLMATGQLSKIVDNYKSHYSERAKVMIDCIKKYLPEDTKYYGGGGGYFVWTQFNDKYDIPQMISDLSEKGVILAGGDNFEVYNNTQGWNNCVRLCLSFLTSEQIEEGFKIWAELFEDHKYTKSK